MRSMPHPPEETARGSPQRDVFSVSRLNETARRLWPGQDAIGQPLIARFGPEDQRSLTVVGVVRDAQLRAVGESDRYFVYLPADDTIRTQLSTIVRSDADIGELSSRVRRIVEGFDADLAVRVRPLEANIAHWQGLSSLATGLASSLGGLALAIASLGIFGVVSYTVTCRTREIGLRMALGASISDVLWLILARTLRPMSWYGWRAGLPVHWPPWPDRRVHCRQRTTDVGGLPQCF